MPHQYAQASNRRIPSVASFESKALEALMAPARGPTDRATFWLRRDIVRGVFPPAARLKVAQLARFYDLGHSTTREAILLLSPSGLVVHEHQKGYRVAGVSVADYQDVLEVYRQVYELALTMALERGDDAWEERVLVVLHRTSKVPKVLLDGDPEGREMWQRAYKRLHHEILSGCGSRVLLTLFADLGNRLERYLNLFGDLESDRRRDHRAEHRALVEVVLQRDLPRVLAELDAFFARNQPVRESVVAALQGEQTR